MKNFLTGLCLLFCTGLWAKTHYLVIEPATGKPFFFRDTAKQFDLMSSTLLAIGMGYKHQDVAYPVSINFMFSYFRGPAKQPLTFSDNTSVSGISTFMAPELTVKYHFYRPLSSWEPYVGMGFMYLLYGTSADTSAYTSKKFQTMAVDFIGGIDWYVVNSDMFTIQFGADLSIVPFISYNFSDANFVNGSLVSLLFHIKFGWGMF